MGTRGVIATGHYLATTAGMEAFKKGGNAFDAGVSAAMALKVTKMGYAGWNGVAPLILYRRSKDGRSRHSRRGGNWPPRVGHARVFSGARQGPDLSLALVPADVDVWLATLARYGTFSFEEAAGPALAVAEDGYHLYKHQKGLLDLQQEQIQSYEYNVRFWFPNGVGEQRLGDLMMNADLGKLIRYMMDAEKKALGSGASREEGIHAARDAFYQGEPARAAAALYEGHAEGLVRYDDLASYESEWMAPLHTSFGGYDVYVCDGWSQGPRLVLALNILESFDLEALGYNTSEYIHVLSQAIELAMADSHKHVGDPDFVDVPEGLYSKVYGRKRAELIDRDRAFSDMPPWGDPARMRNVATDSPEVFAGIVSERNPVTQDTTSLNVMDADGNVFSMTRATDTC